MMIHNDMKKKRMMDKGFSIVELVAVIAIMAALVAVISPMFVKQINNSQKDSCVANREAVLSIYERAVYDEKMPLSVMELADVLSGTNPYTRDEVMHYITERCPVEGTWSITVTLETSGKTIGISCNHAGHGKVEKKFVGFTGSELGEGLDDPL